MPGPTVKFNGHRLVTSTRRHRRHRQAAIDQAAAQGRQSRQYQHAHTHPSKSSYARRFAAAVRRADQRAYMPPPPELAAPHVHHVEAQAGTTIPQLHESPVATGLSASGPHYGTHGSPVPEWANRAAELAMLAVPLPGVDELAGARLAADAARAADALPTGGKIALKVGKLYASRARRISLDQGSDPLGLRRRQAGGGHGQTLLDAYLDAVRRSINHLKHPTQH